MSRALFASRLVSNPGSVLDVGCRDGELSRYLPGPYAGADLIPGPHVKYVGDISTADIPERFDTVFALDILEHLEHPSMVFDRLAAVAKRNLVVSLPNCYDLISRVRFARGKPLGGKYRFTEAEPLDRHRWLMTRNEIHDFFRAKALKHGMALEIRDMRYGSAGHPTLASRAGRTLSAILPPSLSTATVFGVFTKSGH